MILMAKGIIAAVIALLQFVLGVFMIMDGKKEVDDKNKDDDDE